MQLNSTVGKEFNDIHENSTELKEFTWLYTQWIEYNELWRIKYNSAKLNRLQIFKGVQKNWGDLNM